MPPHPALSPVERGNAAPSPSPLGEREGPIAKQWEGEGVALRPEEERHRHQLALHRLEVEAHQILGLRRLVPRDRLDDAAMLAVILLAQVWGEEIAVELAPQHAVTHRIHRAEK